MASIETILATHVDGLLHGNDSTQRLLIEHEEIGTELRLLFRLAKALHKVLRPLAAPPEIATLIYEDIREEAGTVHWAEQIEKRQLFWVIGALASVIAGLAGVIVWLLNRSGGNVPTAV